MKGSCFPYILLVSVAVYCITLTMCCASLDSISENKFALYCSMKLPIHFACNMCVQPGAPKVSKSHKENQYKITNISYTSCDQESSIKLVVLVVMFP